MGVLSSQQIRAMLSDSPPLVAGFVNVDEQLQANGFDMTLESIAAFTGAGRIGVSNSDRVLAETEDLAFDAESSVHLQPGVYAVRLNETVALPRNVMALAKPRSTLLRNGAAAHNAVWDAGYTGRAQIQLTVYNPHGLTLARNARIVQMVFFTLDDATETPYDGIYQGEATTPAAARQ
ncbi:MAG: deoxyuridine 5'-triphosphate nucleotidohydrolase [Chloroflexi bacterium]|nr:deoxyuridine 5'-triphosphate nucleotidohydrolase [Chloroflexota bacterium]